ncbi:MAG: prephenate dehydratase [Candidatus Omnitrophica bacterium]|nr:prephenate dehydratase [Candidatus Omnitrophota bacterium]
MKKDGDKQKETPPEEIEKLREKIDKIDGEIIGLLNERTKYVLDIAQIKNREGREVYAPDREYEVYRKIDQVNKGPLKSDSLKSVYREIMSASLALEKPIKIAYLGPDATFTHMAALGKFGSSVSYQPCVTITEVFTEVEKQRAEYGVIPIENSTEGAVTHTLDMFMDSDLKICSEIIMPISHNVLTTSASLKDIKRLYSNPQVFGQCRGWIEAHLPRVELIDTASTAAAAARALKEDGSAAIASELAATIYGLNVLARGVEDSSSNVTRFLVICRTVPAPTGNDKTSVLISIKDRVGALYDMLDPIKNAKLNMTKIESRPSKKKAWEYFFFIDLEGHIADPHVKETIDSIESQVRFLKVLGSYPSAKIPS